MSGNPLTKVQGGVDFHLYLEAGYTLESLRFVLRIDLLREGYHFSVNLRIELPQSVAGGHGQNDRHLHS